MALIEEIVRRGVFPEGAAFGEIQPKEIKLAPQDLADETALKIVVQNTLKAEQFISARGWIIEWSHADRLYLFQVPPAFWEGTQIPRANLGVPLVYEHIESILPQIITGLKSDDPPFNLNPRPGTDMSAARANVAVLSWELDQSNFFEELRRGVKEALLYGTGIFKWGWKTETRKRKVYRRQQPSKYVNTGMGVTKVPQTAKVIETEVEEEINHPTFESIHIRHVLVDPSHRVADISKARYVIHRMYMTLNDIEALRDVEGYNLPPFDQLKLIFFPPKETAIKAPLETYGLTSGSSFDLSQEFKSNPRFLPSSVDPTNQPLEVLEYWTKDRVYTVVQRKWVIRNEANPFGVIPFCSVGYADITESFYSMGVAKLIGGEQRMQQGVLNAFLDDLSLSINSMFKRRRGANVPTQQLRMRPGGIIDTDDQEGVDLFQRQPLPMEVFTVLDASDQRAQRRTAANELVVQGSMPSMNSSITRTATGVQALSGGSGARLQYFIENIAHNVFIPTLEYFHQMNGIYLTPSQIQKILGEMASDYSGDTLDLLNGQYDFDIVAAARLQSRKSMSAALPMLFQFLLAEPVTQALQMQGKKVDVGELVNMAFDASGWPNRQSVIVDMNQDDEARMAMMNPGVQQIIAQQQKMQQQHANDLDTVEEENIARSGRDVIKALIDKGMIKSSDAEQMFGGSGQGAPTNQ